MMLWQSCKESNKNVSGGVNKQQDAIGSIMKNQEVSKSFRKFKKHQEGITTK